MKRIAAYITTLLSIAILAGCATLGDSDDGLKKPEAQVTLFLHGPEKAEADITFQLLNVQLLSGDGDALDLLNEPQNVNSKESEGRQILISEGTAPAGSYTGLRLFIKDAIQSADGSVDSLALTGEEVDIQFPATLAANQNTTFFLDWDADASLKGSLFTPVLAVRSQSPELSSLLIYVTNEEADSVSVINRRSGDIAATVMVGKNPRGIATSHRAEQLKVYVANAGSNSISVIDPTTNRVEAEIPVRFGREPEGIAVASTAPDKELLFVANYGSDTLSVIDAVSYQELEKIDVGRGPVFVVAEPPAETLIGTRFLSFEEKNILAAYRNRYLNVYVANRDSNSVSVVRIDTVTSRSSEVFHLDVEWRPVSISIDYPRGKAYVAGYESNKISVIDILEVVKGNSGAAVSTINNVGFSIIDVVADPTFDRLYLLRETSGEVMIIRPFSEGAQSLQTIMPPVMGLIPVGKSPREIRFDPEKRKLYVVNRGSDSVSVIDKTTKRVEEVIPVGRHPYGIAIFPQ